MDRRAKIRLGLHPLYLPKYDALCEKLPDKWQPYSGWRSFVEQEALWMKGRVLAGSKVTDAKSGESPHNYGMASDWVTWSGGVPLWLPATDVVWEEYVEAIEAVPGLKAGKSFHDTDHNELHLSCSWRDVAHTYKVGGIDAAYRFIESRLME